MERRPIYLNLFAIRFPITAWVSILHRLSGVIVFLFIPGLLWILQESLLSEEHYLALIKTLHFPWVNLILWGVVAALLYHLIAGVRHLLMDIHIGESKRQGRLSAFLVFGLVFILLVILRNGLW